MARQLTKRSSSVKDVRKARTTRASAQTVKNSIKNIRIPTKDSTKTSSTRAAQGASKLKNPLGIKDEKELSIIKCRDRTTGAQFLKWYYHSKTDESYMGTSRKSSDELTLDDFIAALEPIPDDQVYPEVPAKVQLTMALKTLDKASVYIKRSGLKFYLDCSQPDTGRKQHLSETLVMEEISKKPHPYIVRYHGCHVNRGRITKIVLEKLGQTLEQMAYDETDKTKFAKLDKEAFLAGIESAAKYLHSLGYAHNDINPCNIMVRDNGMPVLIDFDSCRRIGEDLRVAGTPGFMDPRDKEYAISRARHDEYSIKRLDEWWDEKHTAENHFYARALAGEKSNKKASLKVTRGRRIAILKSVECRPM